MEIKVVKQETHHENEQKLPLLNSSPTDNSTETEKKKTLIQRAITQTFHSTAHLANLLPTGTVLIFQLLSPILTDDGDCDSATRSMTLGLLVLCGLSCFLLSFTDSFKDKQGNVVHVFATFKGIWIIDGSVSDLDQKVAEKFKLKFIDFMHAFMSVSVFVAVALFDQNVVSCFFPAASSKTEKILDDLPVAIGVICSTLFVAFPTKRHGVGFPLNTDTTSTS